MKRFVAGCIIFCNIFALAEDGGRVCLEIPSDLNASSSLQREFNRMYAIKKKEAGEKLLRRRILFANEYLRRYGLNERDKDKMLLFVLNYLSRQYNKKILEENRPTDEEAYSYYLLHKKQYPMGYEKSKEKVKQDLLNLKSFQILQKEYERLANQKD